MSELISETLNLNSQFVNSSLNFLSENPIYIEGYFAPTVFALIRKTHNLRAIFICNLIAGFTGISWFIVLIWAMVEPENKPNKPAGNLCPHCQELIRPAATVCHHCHQALKQ